jgi:peroxiredoxin
MHALLLLALFQAAQPSSVALRSGCAVDDEQIAAIGASDSVQVVMALAGESQTCYKVTLHRSGEKLTGYVLGDSLPAIRVFIHGRELASEAAADAEARLARDAEKRAKAAEATKHGEPAKPPDPLISTKFADFSGRDITGKPFSLSGLNARVTLVTFWSPSDRSAMEGVRPLYNWLHSKGLEAVGISTDPNLGRIWKALDDVNLPFAQVADTSGLAARYNVGPKGGKVLVLDQNHRIVAAGAMGPEITKAVRQALSAPADQ